MKSLLLTALLVSSSAFAAQEIINIGGSPNDGTGDTLRSAMQKTNDNFTELYTPPGSSIPVGAITYYPYTTIPPCTTLTTPQPKVCGDVLFGASTGIRFVSSGGFSTAGLITTGNSVAMTTDTAVGASQQIFSYAMDTTNPTLQMFRPTTWGLAQVYTTTLTPYIRGQFGVSGTVTSGSAFFTQISLSGDSVATVAGGGPGGASILYLSDNMNSASLTGNRVGLTTQINVASTTGNTAVGPYFYVGGSMQCIATANDNGTAGAGNGRGNCFGSNPIARLNNAAATYYQNVAGEEINVEMVTGTSAAWKDGLRIVKYATDNVHGTFEDAALVFADQVGTGVPWTNLIQIGSPTGVFPINGGSIMTTATTAAGGSAYSVAHGIDFSGLTCTSDCFKSPSFSVDGSGNSTANQYFSTGTLNVSGTYAGPGTIGANMESFNRSLSGNVSNAIQYAPVFWQVHSQNFNKQASPRIVPAMELDHFYGGSGDIGNFGGILASTHLTTSATGNLGAGQLAYYVAGTFPSYATVNDGGSAGTGNGYGTLFGVNAICNPSSGATFLRGCVGMEINTQVETGASVEDKVGLQIIQTSTDAIAGTLENSAIVIGNQAGAVGWDIGLAFGQYFNSWPMKATGTLLGCAAATHSGSCGTTTNGIDWSNVVFTGDFLKSAGFEVTGTGNIKVNTPLYISVTAPTINSHFNTSGDSITGASTAAFQVTVGNGAGTSTGSLTMPTASNGWACSVADVTTPAANAVQQTGSTTTSVTVTNYVRTTGVAGNFPNSDKLVFHCGAF